MKYKWLQTLIILTIVSPQFLFANSRYIPVKSLNSISDKKAIQIKTKSIEKKRMEFQISVPVPDLEYLKNSDDKKSKKIDLGNASDSCQNFNP